MERFQQKKTNMHIIPSILVPDQESCTRQFDAIRDHLSLVQLDIADGIFVPNKTWAEPHVVESIAGNLELELHLMVQEPRKEIERWLEVSQVKRILFHYESDVDIREMVSLIHAQSWQAALVLNPDTPIDVLDPYLDMLDGVMFMGVYPGKQGTPFLPKVLDNIAAFRAKETNHFVELDGGVNLKTLPDIVKTRVDAVCPGSAIWATGDPADNVKNMQHLINSLTDEEERDTT